MEISDREDKSPSLSLRESCGLAHEPQVIEIAVPTTVGERFSLQDTNTGQRWPGQRAIGKNDRGYVLVKLPADTALDLRFVEAIDADKIGAPEVRAGLATATVELSNGLIALRCFLGEAFHPADDETCVAGPVLGLRRTDGVWRGGSFFDSRSPVVKRVGRVLEKGPVRISYQFRAELRNGGWYEATITLDREACFARIRESFSTSDGDQLVWDFHGDDLPATMHTLDSTAGMTSRPLDYSIDRRQARLWCWTQQSQLFDLVDGLAIDFAETGDTVGLVTLRGGSWRGGRLNHIEAWARRWADDAPWTRRRMPAEARADAMPGPDVIPARGRPVCRPHFTFEAWLGKGERDFALVLTSQASLLPAGYSGEATLTHFEDVPAPERYRAEQGLLRRLHVQRGLFSLEDQLAGTFVWPEEIVRKAPFDESLRHHLHFVATDPRDPANKLQMLAYVEARVRGFWEASGLAYTNPVVSRAMAPYMDYFEWLRGEGLLEAVEVRQLRAWFAFLATLFASDHCYPGKATMTPLGDPDGVEPTLTGMANQNFYTDVFNVHGIAAQVFSQHPSSPAWRARAMAAWSLQLDYHMYPESGVWEESHTYYLHVLHTIHPLLARWRDDGVVDFFSDKRVQLLVGAMLSQFTPRDALYGGRRHLLAWGDHDANPHSGYVADMAAFAVDFETHAPRLAGELAWLAEEMGGGRGRISPRAPVLANEDVRGLGFVFRENTPTAGEVLVALRAGAAWGHHHNDDGSLQVFAFGRALIVDACHGHSPKDGKLKFSAQGHSRLTPIGVDTANYLWRFSRGWISASSTEASFPYAVSWLPTQMQMGTNGIPQVLERPLRASRTVVRLDAGLFAIIDQTDGQRASEIYFHLGLMDVVVDGPRLRGAFPEGAVELIAAASNGEWQLAALSDTKDGEKSRSTQSCKWTLGTKRTHITVLALVPVSGMSPEVTANADGTVRIADRGKIFGIAQLANCLRVTSAQSELDVPSPPC